MGGEEEEGGIMRASGWAFLVISWVSITALTVFCFYKILTKKKVD